MERSDKNCILRKFQIENAHRKIRTNYPFVELYYLISLIFTRSFFIEFWKRTQSTIAMKWGVEGTYVLTHFKFHYIYYLWEENFFLITVLTRFFGNMSADSYLFFCM